MYYNTEVISSRQTGKCFKVCVNTYFHNDLNTFLFVIFFMWWKESDIYQFIQNFIKLVPECVPKLAKVFLCNTSRHLKFFIVWQFVSAPICNSKSTINTQQTMKAMFTTGYDKPLNVQNFVCLSVILVLALA